MTWFISCLNKHTIICDNNDVAEKLRQMIDIVVVDQKAFSLTINDVAFDPAF